MAEENNLLLETILHEQRAMRDAVSELTTNLHDDVLQLTASMVSKQDFNDYRVEMKNHFDEMKKTTDKLKGDITITSKAESKNTGFRTTITNTAKYIAGSLLVAGLSIASTVFISHFNNSAASAATPSAFYSPAPFKTPLKVNLKFPLHSNFHD